MATVSDFLVERLRAWGTDLIYGYPGDGINGILGALASAKNGPQFIQARHEETAAFMACGHAKFTGRPGVCLATSGPGAIHLLTGLYDAKVDHQPVVAIVGQQARTAIGADYLQEVDLQTLFKDVAHEYVHTVSSPEQLPVLVDRAFRIAMMERTVTCLIFPADIQEAKAVKQTPHEMKIAPGGTGVVKPSVLPPEDALEKAAEILNAGRKVAILIGQGARHAADEVRSVAELLGAGVAKALLGKDVLPDDLPFVTGTIGLLGTRPSYEMMAGCDTLLMVGSSFPYSQFLPEIGQARGIQIDIDGKKVGIRYPMELNLVGDSQLTLQALLPRLKSKADRSWQEFIQKEIADWSQLLDHRATYDAQPVNPRLVFSELSKQLPDKTIMAVDSGSATHWYAQYVRMREGMRGSVSGSLATMGCAVPYAIAAKLCFPDRCAVALVGDGAMQMNGMAELLTIAHYRKRWENEDPRFIVLVIHNNDLSLVTWEMRALAGNPKFEDSQALPACDYAGFAESIGLRGIRIESAEQVVSAMEEAFAARQPVVIDAHCDPEVPPLPPHVTWEQTRNMLSAVVKGDPYARKIIGQSFRAKFAEMAK
jgi:pyruvate dehydrogenase (quinone)